MEKKTKGQLFREANGYSKTRKRLMSKHGVSTIGEYRAIAKKDRDIQKSISKKKRDAAKAGKKPSDKKKSK